MEEIQRLVDKYAEYSSSESEKSDKEPLSDRSEEKPKKVYKKKSSIENVAKARKTRQRNALKKIDQRKKKILENLDDYASENEDQYGGKNIGLKLDKLCESLNTLVTEKKNKKKAPKIIYNAPPPAPAFQKDAFKRNILIKSLEL